jgi:GT2 family glycosyltransferase
VLLNNDTEVAAGWLTALTAPFQMEPGLGMTTSKLLLFDDRDRLHTTGDRVHANGLASNRGFGEHDRGQYDDAFDVFGANAAAGAYRRAMLDEIGLFEAAFESYFEDVDLAWRARLAGWGCRFVPEAVVFHHVSATGGGPYASYRVARNRLWTIVRNMPAGLLRRHGAAIVAAQARIALDALRHVRGAAARATLRGQIVGATTWPRWLAARRRIQSARRIDEAQLSGLLEAER